MCTIIFNWSPWLNWRNCISLVSISSRSHNSTARTVYETLRGEFEKSGQKNRGVRVEFRTITVALELLTLCVHLSADWIETRKKLEVSLNTQGTWATDTMAEKSDLVPAFDHLSVSNGGAVAEDGTRPSMVTVKNSGEDDANLTRTKSTSGKCLSFTDISPRYSFVHHSSSPRRHISHQLLSSSPLSHFAMKILTYPSSFPFPLAYFLV